jgi:hypothetical protein
MRKTYIAICATAALGLCLIAPKGASALPAADGAGKALSAVASKSAVTQVRGVGAGVSLGGFHARGIRAGGIGHRRFGYGVGYRRFGLGYGLGYRRFGLGWRAAALRRGYGGYYGGLGYGWGWPFGLGAGLGAAGAGCGYGHVRFVQPGTSFCTCGWSWYGNSQDCACGYY